jgi:hypothetical protein
MNINRCRKCKFFYHSIWYGLDVCEHPTEVDGFWEDECKSFESLSESGCPGFEDLQD